MYFPMRSAVSRLGGISEAAKKLSVSRGRVEAWVANNIRARPDDETLAQLAELSGISLESFQTYFQNLEAYKANEYFRRRRPG